MSSYHKVQKRNEVWFESVVCDININKIAGKIIKTNVRILLTFEAGSGKIEM